MSGLAVLATIFVSNVFGETTFRLQCIVCTLSFFIKTDALTKLQQFSPWGGFMGGGGEHPAPPPPP